MVEIAPVYARASDRQARKAWSVRSHQQQWSKKASDNDDDDDIDTKAQLANKARKARKSDCPGLVCIGEEEEEERRAGRKEGGSKVKYGKSVLSVPKVWPVGCHTVTS